MRTWHGLFLISLALPAFSQRTMFPPVLGTRQMVGAANNLEVEAGFRILEQGGNAVDAGVASTLAAAVTEQSRFGLGGEMPLLVKMAGKPVVAISGIGVAPAKATVEYYSHRQPEAWETPGRIPPIPASDAAASSAAPKPMDPRTAGGRSKERTPRAKRATTAPRVAPPATAPSTNHPAVER